MTGALKVDPGTTDFTPVRRILVVDDDRSLRAVLVRLLRRAGYCTIEAPDAATGIEVVSTLDDTPLAVVADVDMPGVSVMRLVEFVRARDPAVRIVLVSGGHSDLEVAEAVRHGTVRVLGKPFTGVDLLSRLREET